MLRNLSLLPLAFAVAATAHAQRCPDPADGTTALFTAASTLEAGERCYLETNLTYDGLRSVGEGPPVQWADSGGYLRGSRELHFIGRDAGCGGAPYVHIVYDERSNRWNAERAPFNPCGHSYDHIAVDPEGNRLFFREYAEAHVNIYEDGEWTRTPDLGGWTQTPAVGIAYMPDFEDGNGAIVWAQDRRVAVLVDGEGRWREFDLPTDIGAYHNVAEYSPGANAVLLGGGNGAGDVLYRFDPGGALTRMPSAPVGIGIHGSRGTFVSAVPTSSEFLVYRFEEMDGGGGQWWRFDIDAENWGRTSAPPALSGRSFQAPITDYGVVAFFDSRPPMGGEPVLWIYREQDSDLPPATSDDAGVPDMGMRDAGVSDMGASDTGRGDAGTSDAAIADAGPIDPGARDGGGGRDDARVDQGVPDFPDGSLGPPGMTEPGGCAAHGTKSAPSVALLALAALVAARRRR
ncbi:MAG: MYXO-CTERM sorting domain-containing protein [Myxococcota bacterium]